MRKDVLYCSFCGKNQHEVRKLVAGPSAFICDECITLCMDILVQEALAPSEGSEATSTGLLGRLTSEEVQAVLGADEPAGPEFDTPEQQLQQATRTIIRLVETNHALSDMITELKAKLNDKPRHND